MSAYVFKPYGANAHEKLKDVEQVLRRNVEVILVRTETWEETILQRIARGPVRNLARPALGLLASLGLLAGGILLTLRSDAVASLGWIVIVFGVLLTLIAGLHTLMEAIEVHDAPKDLIAARARIASTNIYIESLREMQARLSGEVDRIESLAAITGPGDDEQLSRIVSWLTARNPGLTLEQAVDKLTAA